MERKPYDGFGKDGLDLSVAYDLAKVDAEDTDLDVDKVFEDEVVFDGYEDVTLIFIDDTDQPLYPGVEDVVADKLSEYSFEEILDLNEIDEQDALSLLFIGGHIGLPYAVEEPSEEEQDLQEEEAEEV